MKNEVNQYIEQHLAFMQKGDIDGAHSSLLLACQCDSKNFSIWTKLAFFYEIILMDKIQADNSIENARKLYMSQKNASNEDIASYFKCLGYILCNRGNYYKGLSYIKKSLEINPESDGIRQFREKVEVLKNNGKIDDDMVSEFINN